MSLIKAKAQRFPKNPEDFWGPKARAKGKKPDGCEAREAPGAAAAEESGPAAKQPRLS